MIEKQRFLRREGLAGLTTFLTMSYIIFVQPAVLSGRMFGFDTGMPFEAVMAATCLSAAVACLIMGLYARYPIAQAPGMGENFFFVFGVLPAAAQLAAVQAGATTAWQVALGVVLISGLLFLLLSLTGVRALLMDAVSPSLKSGIAVGIGVFIAFIGLRNAGLILTDPGTAVKLNADFLSPDLIVFFGGLAVTVGLQARGVRGAILWGILAGVALSALAHCAVRFAPAGTALADWGAEARLLKQFAPTWRIVGRPPSVAPLWLQCDWRAALTLAMLPYVVIFLFDEKCDRHRLGRSQRSPAGLHGPGRDPPDLLDRRWPGPRLHQLPPGQTPRRPRPRCQMDVLDPVRRPPGLLHRRPTNPVNCGQRHSPPPGRRVQDPKVTGVRSRSDRRGSRQSWTIGTDGNFPVLPPPNPDRRNGLTSRLFAG